MSGFRSLVFGKALEVVFEKMRRGAVAPARQGLSLRSKAPCQCLLMALRGACGTTIP